MGMAASSGGLGRGLFALGTSNWRGLPVAGELADAADVLGLGSSRRRGLPCLGKEESRGLAIQCGLKFCQFVS